MTDGVPTVDSMLIEVTYHQFAGGVGGKPEACWVELSGGHVHLIPAQRSPNDVVRRPCQGGSLYDEVCSALSSNVSWKPVTLKKLQRVGQYHPRIFRNGISAEFLPARAPCKVRSEDRAAVRTRCVAFHRIQRQLLEVFEMVSPIRQHETVFGAGIQQVLTLAAREVETLLRAAFEENAPSFTRNPNINNWHGLHEPMRLGEWSAALRHFPEWGTISPFCDWTISQAPSWWTANNKFKHEEELSGRANLGAAIAAMAAIRILLEGQFGPGVEEFLPDAGLTIIDITSRPRWSVDELYFAPARGEPLVLVPTLG